MIEKKNLLGIHYFMSDEQFHLFWKETVRDTTLIKAFPHYLIVDKKGTILHNNAPRPSHASLEPILQQALNQ